jgi:hypothetical protein
LTENTRLETMIHLTQCKKIQTTGIQDIQVNAHGARIQTTPAETFSPFLTTSRDLLKGTRRMNNRDQFSPGKPGMCQTTR